MPAAAISQAVAASIPCIEPRLELRAQARDARRQLVASVPGASPSQNGIVGGSPCASSTRIRPALDPQDPVGDVAELEDVALQALDREVLVHRADELRLRLEHHLVVGVVRNGAAGGDRGEARAASPLQDAGRRASWWISAPWRPRRVL